MVERSAVQAASVVITPGTIRAGDRRYVFDMSTANRIDANPDCTTARGAMIEGERMLVGLMHMPRGMGPLRQATPGFALQRLRRDRHHAVERCHVSAAMLSAPSA
jgi:hypothetical protein